MATAAVEVDHLSGYLGLPQDVLVSILDAPTIDLVQSVLRAVSIKANEHIGLDADKVRLEIELESAVRSAETRNAGLKASLETAQKTTTDVRIELKESENTRSALEGELQILKSSSSTSSSEIETLRTRTVAVLESKTTANDNLAQELQKQHQKGLELSQQITTLQQSVQNSNSAASSAKFREQSLKQENELKTKNSEAQKFRKEKGARIAELQRLNEDTNSNFEALKKTEQALRNRLDEVQQKAEDAQVQVQQLQESAAKTEEGFRQELESARRLAELQSQQTETHRNRLLEVEAGLEKIKDDAADQVGKKADALDGRVHELESEIETIRMEAIQARPGSTPGTPRQGLNGSMYGRSGSPALFGTPGSVRSKSTITATQAIDELYKVKALLTKEKSRSKRLESEMDEMVGSLEAKQPYIEEIENEHERLKKEMVDMSKFKDLRKAESGASTAQADAQIKLLLYELDARERARFERLASGDVSEEALEGLTDTDRFITQRLVVFRNVAELQEKNQELLKITRQLGEQMESEEALATKHQAAKDHDEVETLRATVENYKDELQATITRSESYTKERDMFRRMLQHRGQIPPNSDLASMFGQSTDGNQNGPMPSVEQTFSASTNYPVVLRELQGQFDQYREEQAIDRRTMKEQTEKLSLERGALQAEIAKIISQLTLANERYEMLHANYTMLQNENKELQKRGQILSEAAAKQDLRTQQVAEDLIEAKGLVESMRNETANLKAEKKLWKDIQDRLSQDNEDLMNERARLNNLITNQQTLQNEREISESEARRRLQTQVETLETELSTTKRKLSDELEDSKKVQLRKEFDSQQNQKRIDDLAGSLGQVREELVAAVTTRDHLQARVDELAIQLKSAEERVVLLQPRPTPRADVATDGTNGHVSREEENREQELSIEISELKRDLDLAKSELESTKSQTEQYKSISQSSEEELQSLNATQDQYRDEMDRIIEEKDSKVQELQQRVYDISTELTTTNNELTLLRNQQSEAARRSEEDKAILQQEITRLKDEDERHATASQFHQQDLRAQAAIATKAQLDYENELVKHAEAAKLLQNLRAEHNQLKSESASLKADAESARVTLSQSEISWEERRLNLEQELGELRSRRDDVNAQNKLLHQQLENVGAQISALQQGRAATAEAGESGFPGAESTVDRTADGLRELNVFLRREKEIVEVQYELKAQEAKRLQQQLDYTQSQLDESRLKLDQERRLQADGSRSSTAHKDLMEKLNELNLFRESSITLRNEARQAQTQLSEKTKRVEELMEQVQPLEAKLRELEHSKETSEGEMVLLREDRDRWQKRTQDIISKYDRIDPVEMEQLKETIENLKTERDSLLEGKQPLQDRIQILEGEKVNWQQSRQKIIDQAKERSRIQSKDIKDRASERDAAVQEKTSLRQQLSELQQQLETAVREKDSAEQQLNSLTQELGNVKGDLDRALAAAAAAETPGPDTSSQEKSQQYEEQLLELRRQLNAVDEAKVSLEAELKNLREQLQTARYERDNAVTKAAAARPSSSHNANNLEDDSANEEGQVDERPKLAISDDEKRALEERIAIAEAKANEQEEKATKIEEQMENTLKTRSEKMKAALNKKLAEHKKDLENDSNLKLEQTKLIWLAENRANVPATPVTTTTVPKLVSTEEVATPTKPKDNNESIVPLSPAVPTTPAQQLNTTGSTSKPLEITENQARELLTNNTTMKGVFIGNVKKKVDQAVAKTKEEAEKDLAKVVENAAKEKENAVKMSDKRFTLKISLLEGRSKTAAGKLGIVETAATETPQRPVSEVWELAKAWKPDPQPQAAPATQPNGPGPIAPTLAAQNSEVKTENPSTWVPQPLAQPGPIASGPNGGQATLISQIPQLPPMNNVNRGSGIPTMRGGGAGRARGGPLQPYQAGRGMGAQGRGRGNGQRGGLNASAQPYNPQGQGQKRPREEGSMSGSQGNTGKRPRGGGPSGHQN
ncbi:hypothetical protein BJ875DRAFT_528441 [Amylocarpus encephaloides]|uniref:Nucleoprotein TPR/MLP1 domain-containing protein n=1 Tax=Amylocarpus encephaloides TaxID=45428 RepID=A0A9P7YSP0_9HELO|nr:hypothetical protein BJ875DRAFT_528441 [Amylocarpus encephaloides]